MKHMFVTASAVLLLLFGLYSVSEAGTYASSLRTSNPDTATAFDGSFTDGTGALLWFTLNGPADTAHVTIYKSGVFVRMLERDSLGTGDQCVAWDGKDSSGAVVGVGNYTFSVFTSDTGSADTTWKQVWQNSVYLGSGIGLSSRDIIVVNDPANPLFGDLLMTESSSYNYARILVARSNGTKLSTFGEANYPQVAPSGSDPWYIEAGKNGKIYVSCNTLRRFDVYNYGGGLVEQIADTAKIGLPRGFALYGSGAVPTMYIATGRALVRRNTSGVVDTLFTVDTTAGYVRDVEVDDSGYVYFSFGRTSAAYNMIARLSPALAVIDTMTVIGNVTHLALFHGANATSNADDILYARIPGATGGIFKVDFAAKTATKLFTPATSTSANHSMGVDMFGNIYYSNPSNEWAQMWRPPTSAPTKYTTMGGVVNVLAATSKVMDNFETGTGHFGTAVNYSGSTVGVAAGSTAGRDLTDGHLSTASMKLVLKDDAASHSDWGVRFLSGIGTPASNDSLGAVGWVGFWVKTRTAPVNAMVAIGLDDPSDPVTKRSVSHPVINDGEWHLYEWNIADSTQWTAWVVTSGSPKIKGPRVSIDALWFMAPDSSADWTLNLDDVSYNGAGMIGTDVGTGDVTSDGTVSALDASWMLQYSVGSRTFTTAQKKTGDVNISSNGLDVTATDAAVTLAAVVGQVSLPHVGSLPLAVINSSGPLPEKPVTIGAVTGTPGQVVNIPVFVDANVAGVRAAQMKLIFDASGLKVRSISTTDLTNNFMLASNIQDGSATIAMASASALAHGGQLLTIEAEILGSGSSLVVHLENIQLNDNSVSSVTSVGAKDEDVPSTYALEQNYPNPFNPSTTIEYRLPQRAFVEMKIYDITGREVSTLVSSLEEAGTHHVVWNATDAYGMKVASGVYFYRITAGSFTQLKKMLLLK